ncbi:hypothetical protein AgCh_026398 [Apium graveolens]
MALIKIEDSKDMDMAAAAEQLMQLSGDDDNDNRITSSDTANISSVISSDHGNINKRKNGKDVVAAQSHENVDDERSSSNHQLSESLMRLAKRRRRYRSVTHIYMSTKPVRSIG